MCERQCSNSYNDVAIVVKRGSQVIKYIPEKLAIMPTLVLEDGQLQSIDGWIIGLELLVPEGILKTGGGIYKTSVLLIMPGTKWR